VIQAFEDFDICIDFFQGWTPFRFIQRKSPQMEAQLFVLLVGIKMQRKLKQIGAHTFSHMPVGIPKKSQPCDLFNDF